jgi:hypothetical protein
MSSKYAWDADVAALLQVVMWEAASMALMYVAYVCVTFWVSRHDDPLQADAALHEVPQDEGVGESHMQRNPSLQETACCCGPCSDHALLPA